MKAPLHLREEKAKRRLSVIHPTKVIEPVNSRSGSRIHGYLCVFPLYPASNITRVIFNLKNSSQMHSCVHLGQSQKVRGKFKSFNFLYFPSLLWTFRKSVDPSGLTFSGTYHQPKWESSFSLTFLSFSLATFTTFPLKIIFPLCLLKDCQVFETIYKLTIMHLDYVHR